MCDFNEISIGDSIYHCDSLKDMTLQQRGFTLIELLVVIVIIGLLAGIGIASFQGSLSRARYSQVIAHMTEFKDSTKQYQTIYGIYPYDRPPGAVTVAWDPPSGFLIPDFLELFPEPPCSGWQYDFDDWIHDTAHNVDNAKISNGHPNQIVRVTIRDSAGVNRFMYCIFDANTSITNKCTETDEVLLDIRDIDPPVFDCN